MLIKAGDPTNMMLKPYSTRVMPNTFFPYPCDSSALTTFISMLPWWTFGAHILGGLLMSVSSPLRWPTYLPQKTETSSLRLIFSSVYVLTMNLQPALRHLTLNLAYSINTASYPRRSLGNGLSRLRTGSWMGGSENLRKP